MDRWLKADTAEKAPVDPGKEAAWQTAVKAEMAKVWDATGNRDAMLLHVECWLAGARSKDAAGNVCDHGEAPVEVRGQRLRAELYPLMEAVYQEKHPEDFEAKAVEGDVGLGGGLEEPK